jgi:hypothetical protein
MADAKKVTEEVKGLFSRSIQGQIKLFNRVSTMTTDAARQVFAGTADKPKLTVGEGLSRLVDLNLACWSAAADHYLALANDCAGAWENALGLQAKPAPQMARRATKPAGKAKVKARA